MPEDPLSWQGWAVGLDQAPVTPTGRPVLRWAVDTLRELFGETWLRDNAGASGHVPLMSHTRWPLNNRRPVIRLLELAARVSVVRRHEDAAPLLSQARMIHPNRDATANEFHHMALILETAAFAIMSGWSVTYEQALPSGRKPDLWLRRNGIDRLVELTVLNLDREFRSADAWSHKLSRNVLALTHRYSVEVIYDAQVILDDANTAMWLAGIDDACQRTIVDGQCRTVQHNGNAAKIYPARQVPRGATSSGPVVASDLWKRVDARLRDKARQTRGGPPTWIRIDDIGMMFHLTDWSAAPLPERLADVEHNITAVLDGAPHVRGVVLSGGDHPATSTEPAPPQTVWPRTDPPQYAPRHRLAHGPVAMRRPLPGYRQRITFVVPTGQRHVLLPAGSDLEPGLWYDAEPDWLDKALRTLGHPALSAILFS